MCMLSGSCVPWCVSRVKSLSGSKRSLVATWCYVQRGNNIGALTFGAELPTGKWAFPSSPSWMLYGGGSGGGGEEAHCLENVPILIRPETFCNVYLAESRVFRCVFPALLIFTCPFFTPKLSDFAIRPITLSSLIIKSQGDGGRANIHCCHKHCRTMSSMRSSVLHKKAIEQEWPVFCHLL